MFYLFSWFNCQHLSYTTLSSEETPMSYVTALKLKEWNEALTTKEY